MNIKKVLFKFFIPVALILISILFGTVAISKYKTKTTVDGIVEIAKPIIELEVMQEYECITEDTNNTEYYLKVKNYDNSGTVNQIEQKYMLEISTDDKENIQRIDYDLYLINNNSESVLIDTLNNRSEAMTLLANTMKDTFFKIKINNVNSNITFKDSLYITAISESVEL